MEEMATSIKATSIKVFDKDCLGCVKHKRHVMIACDNPKNITDIFLTQDQAKDLANDLAIITKRNEAERRKYIVEGNHPTFKYINLEINHLDELSSKVGKLLTDGYEIIIKPQPEPLGNEQTGRINFKKAIK